MDTNNIIAIITTTINTIFSNLFSSIDNNLYGVLDDIIFISKDILNSSYFEKFLGTSATEGILLICNSLIIGFVLYYALSLLFSYISFSSPMRPSSFILRVIIFTILLNFSYFICEQIINLNSNISLAIRNVGENIFNKNISFSTLIQNLNSVVSVEGESFNVFSLDGLLKGFISLGLFNLVFTYALRYIMIKIFVLLAPFAFLSLFLNKTAWFFQAWLKSFLSLLFVQIVISLILLLTFALDFSSNDLFTKILCVGSIYALIKANGFIKELMGGITTDVSFGLQNFSGLLR